MTHDVLIEPYNEKTDKEHVERMLSDDPYFLGFFRKHEARKTDNIVVARCDGRVVGLVSWGGKYRRTETAVFVKKEYRRNGIGTRLMQKADEYYNANDWTELSMISFPDSEKESARFLLQNGYMEYFSLYEMDWQGGEFPGCPYTIRGYSDADYLPWHILSDTAFWIMRENVGIRPNYFSQPNEDERTRFIDEKENRFVLLDNNIIASVGVIDGNELQLLAVRPDLQGHGYGRAMASFLINEILRRGETTVTLVCVVGNPAHELYKSLSFEVTRTIHFYSKYYRPESRMRSPIGLTTPEDVINELRTYGTLRTI